MHSGRTDNNGGHNDRVNGGYHFHHGLEAHSHVNGVCELQSPKSEEYFSFILLFILFGIFLFRIIRITINRINA